jgi:NADPH:quinone reductase-like Zn-dependent oxidoreductase
MQEAAATPLAALTAYQALLKGGKIQTGSRVLVNGASGGVGSFAVQIAKAMGAHVTGVCSKANTSFVESLGADRVIDYQTENFLQVGDTFDLVFDAVAKSGFSQCKKILKSHGTYVSTMPNNLLFLYQALNFLRSKKAAFIATKASGTT